MTSFAWIGKNKQCNVYMHMTLQYVQHEQSIRSALRGCADSLGLD